MQKTEDSEIFEYRPKIYSCANSSDMSEFNSLVLDKSPILVDTFTKQIADFLPCNFPEDFFNGQSTEQMLGKWLNGTPLNLKGNWVYYPWKNTAVKLLDVNDFIVCRTNRNQIKITAQNQQILKDKNILFVGLSVGQSAAVTFAMQRIGGTLILTDFDDLSLSNMNRIRASVIDLELPKCIIAARAIAEMDPYLNVVCDLNGANEQNIDSLISHHTGKPVDLVVEECDSLEIKILVRLKARELGIPVVMETSDRGMLDVERFDIEKDRPFFHGKLENTDVNKISELSREQRMGLLLNIVDFQNVSQSMKDSVAIIGKTILTWPQLAKDVTLGSSVLAHTATKILLNEPMKSGRYYVDLDQILTAG